MSTKWSSEEGWRSSLKLQMSHLRKLENDERSSPKELHEQRGRVERIWAEGLPELQAKGPPGRFP